MESQAYDWDGPCGSPVPQAIQLCRGKGSKDRILTEAPVGIPYLEPGAEGWAGVQRVGVYGMGVTCFCNV